MLEDPIRLPRIEAAWALRAAPHPDYPPQSRQFLVDDPQVLAGGDLRRSLDRALDQPSGLAQLGQMLFDRRDAEGALELFRRAKRWSPTAAAHHDAEAVALAALGRSEEAVIAMKAAQELAPGDPWIAYRLGLALAEIGAIDEAAAMLRRAVDLDRDLARAWYNLAHAYWKLERLDEALDAIQQAEDLEPSDPDTLSTRAGIHRTRRETTMAEEYEERSARAIEELRAAR